MRPAPTSPDAGDVVEAAPRDASWYPMAHGRGKGAHALHIIRAADGARGACGAAIQPDAAQPAATVEAWQRCQRPGCRVRWPD